MKGYALDMESVVEHRDPGRRPSRRGRSRSTATAPASCSCTAGATPRTPGARCWPQLGCARPARDRRRPAGLRRGDAACTTAPCCRSWTRSPPTWSSAGRATSRSWSRARRSAAASRCGWPSTPGELRLAGVVPVAPDGLELPSWFDPIEEDPIVRELLSIPVPVPGVLVRRAQVERLPAARASCHPSETQRAVVDAFSRDGETRADVAALLESGRGLAPELSTAPFDLIGIRCPVLLVWGAHDRMLPHTDARMALDSLPTTQVELIEGAGPSPAARGHRPPARAAAAVRHLTRKFACARQRPGYALSTMRRTLLADPRGPPRPRPRGRRRRAADRRRRQRRRAPMSRA